MNLTDRRTVQALMERHGFHTAKALGQNFLINPAVCPRMAEACSLDEYTGVLEIGPGIGVLTKELASRAARVVAVELDTRLLPILEETVGDCDNLTVVQGDAMTMDLAALIAAQFAGLRVVVCANLPYYITSPLLMRLLETRLPIDSITVMVQKEAAARLCAQPGTRASGAVTLAVHYYARPEVLFPVSRGSFLPAPQVDSAVIQLHIRKTPAVAVRDEALLFRLVRAGFNQRRKTLVNALAGAGWSKAEAAALLSRAGLPPAVRAEALTLEDFAALADAAGNGPG